MNVGARVKKQGRKGGEPSVHQQKGRRALSTQELYQFERLTLTYPLGFHLDSSI